MTPRQFLAVALLIAAAPFASAQEVPVPEPSEADSQSEAEVINSIDKMGGGRQLDVGDIFYFRIVEEGAPAKRLTVGDAGDVQFPHIGSVMARGLSLEQLTYVVKSELEKEMFVEASVELSVGDPRARAFPSDADPNAVLVVGQVGSEGVIEIPEDGELMLSTAIHHAGGFSRFANSKEVAVHRLVPEGGGERRVIHVEVERVDRVEADWDIPLEPGDVVIVPETLFIF